MLKKKKYTHTPSLNCLLCVHITVRVHGKCLVAGVSSREVLMLILCDRPVSTEAALLSLHRPLTVSKT